MTEYRHDDKTNHDGLVIGRNYTPSANRLSGKFIFFASIRMSFTP